MKLARLLRTPWPPHAFAIAPDELLYGRLNRRCNALERVETLPLAGSWFQLGPVGLLHVERTVLAEAVAALVRRLAKPPARASLVIPNGWLRGVVVDAGNLPRQRQEAEDVVRWRLKKLLPCRPEDVRLDFVRGSEDGRVLVLLALDRPLAVVEESFAAVGIQLGRIEPAALALTGLLPVASDPALLATVEEKTLAVVLLVEGRIALLRHKALPPEGGRAGTFVLRELSRTLSHARDVGGASGMLNVWVASLAEPTAELVASWAAREEGVIVHHLAVGAGRVPELPAVAPVRLWSLLATAWEGET